MIESVIIEDEKRSANLLSNLITEYCPDVTVTGIAASVKTGLQLVLKARPSLIFMDIEMPDGTAFELLEQIPDKKFHVIFTTAFDHYAVRAIKFSALDYLLKPVSIVDLKVAIEKVKAREMDTVAFNNINMLIKNLGAAGNGSGKIALPTVDGHIFVEVQDIIRLDAQGSYSSVVLSNGNKILVSRTLKEFEGFLGDTYFVRVHHSHLINIHHVREYIKGSGGHVIMIDGSKAEVSVRKKEEFLRKVGIR